MPGGQHAPELTSPVEIKLWEMLCKHSGEFFTTSGRGNRAGVEFKYEIKGAEMFVTNRSKSITRATTMQKLLMAVCDFYGDPVDD